ncbi:NAD(P)H dehydrogenase (quinone) [Lewinella aquimaris]|uniref:NAD(P)H dehydrogenase (Quinone) n=1 Tax=Neolewinella aquimaris TaxID=1835722 RepID=A0A840EFJ6_9BACT|nr:SDR family oxidoreductase [Neolewinella aquimaris]MBB4080579.1 NAD(P)H dehydrogenase (quinone) [Neolewinella aquimaris]
MKIAVTSASGQLGSAIVRQLINEVGEDHVVGIARTPEKASNLGVEIRKGDYNSRQQFDEALRGVDTVLLVSGMDDPQKRIQQHRNVIEAAKYNGVSKIVYTGIVGDETDTAFSPIVQSNRQTENDVRGSGLQWVIGRNGIYIEPDLEYIDHYVKDGEITNCAGGGKCTYTSRSELGCAYARMLLDEKHHGQVYNLVGEAITQARLAELLNRVYGTELTYRPVSVAAYAKERRTALGEFMGTVIAGIYEGIQNGAYDLRSDYERAAGRAHKAPLEMIKNLASVQ